MPPSEWKDPDTSNLAKLLSSHLTACVKALGLQLNLPWVQIMRSIRRIINQKQMSAHGICVQPGRRFK